jgi:uroporphyrinogen decarboxylase
VESLKREQDGERVPVIVFTKGGGQWLEGIAACGADVVGLDWTTDLCMARSRVADKVALQGNIDPMVLFGGEQAVRAEVRRTLDRFGSPQRPDGGWGGHVLNLGHGLNQHTPPEAVAALVDETRQHSARNHQN